MTNELVIIENTGEKSVIPVEEIKKYFATGATDAELWAFMGMARAYGLNPFKREIHFAKFGSGETQKAQIMVGYEVYIKRAEATGKLEWWDVKIDGTGMNMKGIFTAKRKDWTKEFNWVVEREEFDKGQSDKASPRNPWKVMPKFMLKKCAISQGMRLLLPEELGGMPYTPEEIVAQVDTNVIDVDFEDVPEETRVIPEEDEKDKALEPLMKKIAGFKTLAELDDWVAKQAKFIFKSMARNEIEQLIADKRKTFQTETVKSDMAAFEMEVWQKKMDEFTDFDTLVTWYDENETAIANSVLNKEIIEYLQKRQDFLKAQTDTETKDF